MLPLMEREVRLGNMGSGKRHDLGGRGVCRTYCMAASPKRPPPPAPPRTPPLQVRTRLSASARVAALDDAGDKLWGYATQAPLQVCAGGCTGRTCAGCSGADDGNVLRRSVRTRALFAPDLAHCVAGCAASAVALLAALLTAPGSQSRTL